MDSSILGKASMNWEIHAETDTLCEWHESEAGRVDYRGPEGWDAWVYIPSGLQKTHATKHKVGECYSSASSAKAAVIRQYRKYAPLRSA
jgi:hypothetical protein